MRIRVCFASLFRGLFWGYVSEFRGIFRSVMFAGATMPTQKRGQEWGGGRATCVSGMFRACFRYVSRPQRLLILVF